MNAKRRKRIMAVANKLDELVEQLMEIREEEQECLDNMPENLQDSERGQQMGEAISILEDAESYIADQSAALTEIAEG